MLSHPLGRQWLNKQLHEKDPEMVPHPLPDQSQLTQMIADLPLRIAEYVDEDKLYMALLQVRTVTLGMWLVCHPTWLSVSSFDTACYEHSLF